jgi:hypothetical protein
MERPSVHNYSVADFLELRAANRLVINETFQRRSIWKPAAKTYLIDSILRGYPIPKMYFRSTIDPKTQSSVREVVDGQQRLRAIFDFADDVLKLSSRANDLSGLRYSDLSDDQKEDFLSYTFVAEQLINAEDDDVLEVFARLNTFNVALNPAELRHAQYQGDFKWLAHELSKDFSPLWDEHHVLPLTQRARMADEALVADWLLQVMQGLIGGESAKLTKAYKNLDIDFGAVEQVGSVLKDTVGVILEEIPQVLDSPLSRPPHLTMLIATVAYVLFDTPVAPVSWLKGLVPMPPRPERPNSASDWERVSQRLFQLAEIIELSEEPVDEEQKIFWRASQSATINLASRARRFPLYLRAFS